MLLGEIPVCQWKELEGRLIGQMISPGVKGTPTYGSGANAQRDNSPPTFLVRGLRFVSGDKPHPIRAQVWRVPPTRSEEVCRSRTDILEVAQPPQLIGPFSPAQQDIFESKLVGHLGVRAAASVMLVRWFPQLAGVFEPTACSSAGRRSLR